MQVYGQLQNAAIETIAGNPSSTVQGRVWYNSSTSRIMVDDGTSKNALFRNDQKFIFGSSGTAANNIRFNRAGASVLQFVTGDDTTAEGTLSTSLAQISAKIEGYTFAGKPASVAANAGRLIYVTDLKAMFLDNGTALVPVGSGGGGGSLKWQEGANAPIAGFDSVNNQIYSFVSGLAQPLYTTIKVPQGYTAGSAIKLYLPFYSPDTSGTALMTSFSTLVRSGTDAYTSTTNQRTSTNAAVTLSGGTQNIPQMVTFDLTSTTGTINGVAVSPGDIINVILSRGADSATSDLAAMVYSAEVTFQ